MVSGWGASCASCCLGLDHDENSGNICENREWHLPIWCEYLAQHRKYNCRRTIGIIALILTTNLKSPMEKFSFTLEMHNPTKWCLIKIQHIKVAAQQWLLLVQVEQDND